MNDNQTTIKIKTTTHERLKEEKRKTGVSIQFMIEKAVNLLLGRKK